MLVKGAQIKWAGRCIPRGFHIGDSNSCPDSEVQLDAHWKANIRTLMKIFHTESEQNFHYMVDFVNVGAGIFSKLLNGIDSTTGVSVERGTSRLRHAPSAPATALSWRITSSTSHDYKHGLPYIFKKYTEIYSAILMAKTTVLEKYDLICGWTSGIHVSELRGKSIWILTLYPDLTYNCQLQSPKFKTITFD